MNGERQWTSSVVPFQIQEPLPGPLAPLDRRHRWSYTKTDRKGDHWYRCRACRRRRRVTPIATLLARRMRDASHHIEEKLSETLFRDAG